MSQMQGEGQLACALIGQDMLPLKCLRNQHCASCTASLLLDNLVLHKPPHPYSRNSKCLLPLACDGRTPYRHVVMLRPVLLLRACFLYAYFSAYHQQQVPE